MIYCIEIGHPMATDPTPMLPPLREDLQLSPGPLAGNGAPSWTIYDPAANRFYRIGWQTFEILSRWHLGSPAAIVAAVAAHTTLSPNLQEVEQVLHTLRQHALLQITNQAGLDWLNHTARATRRNWGSWLLKNYLFLRIPLLHPDRLLSRLLPHLRWLLTGEFLLLILLAALSGLLLVARQWDYFSTTLVHSWQEGDVIPYGIALVLSKSLHELGHALVAKRYGCRVPVMGVAILLLWPVLFTETSDVWRLPERRQRLAVGAAGMLAELALAALATLAWSLLDDGPLRNAAFFLATVTWILTLAVNLNPLMRFDGYFLLADWLEWVNLQERSFAMGRWFVRETLFGLGDPPPESLPKGRRRFLIGFALAVWIYRFFLFLGIALLVYQFFFKILGIFLFCVEMLYFLVRPILTEVAYWVGKRQRMQVNGHTLITGMLLLTLLTALLLPWMHTVEAPATLRAVHHTRLFAPQAARLESPLPAVGQVVQAGDRLAHLHLPELEHRRARIQRDIELLRWQIATSGQDKELLEQGQSLQEQLATRYTELAAVRKEQALLTLTAPFAGTVVDRLQAIAPGEWVAEGESLLQLVDPTEQIVEAFVAGNHPGLAPHAEAIFYAENPDRPPLPCRLLTVDLVNTQRLPDPILASRYGGPILVREEQAEEWIPREAHFRVTLAPQQALPPLTQVLRGQVSITTEPESPAGRMWRYFSSLFLRESGF
ncbi:MAG: HlyD family efflux transporter periplasmic adaptor subunit [Magnetococcus sp. XQGC-1]